MKIVQQSHWDLDGAVSIINVAKAFKNHDFRWKASGYGKIEKMLKEATDPGFDMLFVTDLNFTKEQFKSLCRLKKKDNVIAYVDHHNYPDFNPVEFGEKCGLKIRYSKDYCGAMGTFKFLSERMAGKVECLEELNRITNVYDLWKKDEFDFMDKAHPLNDLFWEYSMEKFLLKFKDGYKLDKEDKEVIEARRKDRSSYIEGIFKEKSIINEEESILMIMNPESKFTNDFTLYYPDFDVYLILSKAEEDTFQYSVRINNRVKLTVKELYDIIHSKVGFQMQCGGHDKTGGLTILQAQMPEFMDAFNDSVAEWKKQNGI